MALPVDDFMWSLSSVIKPRHSKASFQGLSHPLREPFQLAHQTFTVITPTARDSGTPKAERSKRNGRVV